MRRLRRTLLGLLMILALGLTSTFIWLQTDTGRQQVAGWLEAATRDGNTRLKLGTISGTVPTDMTVSHLQLSDGQGPWLDASNIHLRWSVLALLSWRLKVDVLEAETMALSRLPATDQSAAGANSTIALPHLPIDIEIGSISVATIDLAQPVLGTAMTITATAKAAIASDHQLGAGISIRRLDHGDGSEDITGEVSYQPASEHLKIDLGINEVNGGLASRLLGLEGHHTLAIAARGDAPLSSWSGTLAAKLDDQPVLDLTASIAGPAEKRHFDIALTTQPSAFLPTELQALAAGGVQATATGLIAASSSYPRLTIDQAHASSATFDMTADGFLDFGGRSNLRLHIKSLASDALAGMVPGLSWNAASFEGEISGAIDLPNGRLDGVIAGLQYDGERIGELSFALVGKSGASAVLPIKISATAKASEITPRDQKLALLVKDGMRLALTGSIDRQGKIDVDSATIAAGPVALQGNGRAEHWGQQLQATGALEISDLGIFRDLSGLPLKGKLHIDAQASRNETASSLTLDAAAVDFAAGEAKIDGLFGAAPRLGLAIEQMPDGAFQLQRLDLIGRALTLKGSGHGSPAALTLGIDGTIANLADIDKRMNGALQWHTKVSGPLNHLAAENDIRASKVSAMDITASNIALQLTVPDLMTLAGITAAGQASINGIPARITSTIDLPGSNGSQAIQVSSAQLQLGRSTFHAQGKSENNLVAGQVAILIPDLAELQPLTQIDAHGRAALDLTLTPRGGRQDATATLSGDSLSHGKNVTLDHLTATTKLSDLFGAGTNATRIDIKDAVIGQQKVTSLRALLDGPLRRMSLDLRAAGPNLSVDLGGSISHAPDRDSATVDHARLVALGRQIDLQHPVTVTRQATSTHIDNLSLKSGGSQVSLTADLTPESNRIDLELRHLALDLLAAFAPKINIKGDVDGWVRVDGPNHNPRASAKLTVKQITSPAISMAPANANLAATWENGRVAASGDISLDTQHDILTLSATLPVPADPGAGFPRLDATGDLTASAKGHVDLALLNPLLGSSVDQFGGQAEIDMTATGALAAPKMQGHVAITDGRYDNLRYGTRLKAIQAQVIANGSSLQLSSFTARTPGNGSLSGSGDIDLTRRNPVAITMQAQKAQLIDNAMGTATANADLTLSSQGPQQLALTGTIKIIKAEIRIPDRLSGSVEEIAVVERNTSAKKSASPAVAAEPVSPAISASPMKVSLDMTIDAPQQVAVRGRGLDAELGGKLRVGGNISQPAITGQLKLRRGRFDLLGQSLEFDRGVINFDGGTPIDPQLDFAAKAKAEGYDITALMTGTANKPDLALTSTPSLPQDEILARLLFGKAAGSLTAIQAVQLAQATAELAGVSGGPDILDQLRRATGLDRLSVDAGESATAKTTATGPSLSAGRYVAPGVYLGVKQGAKPNSSAATVEIDVTPHIKVETDVGGTAGSKAGINMQWDY